MLKTTVNHNIIVSTWEEYISGFREYYARKNGAITVFNTQATNVSQPFRLRKKSSYTPTSTYKYVTLM